VCACDCGLTVDGEGKLCVEWDAIGTQNGVATDTGFDSSVPFDTDGWERMRFVRSAYVNDTCRDHIVQYYNHIPHINFTQDGTPNYWDAAVFAGHELNSTPDADTFDLTRMGRFRRLNQVDSVARLSVTLHSPIRIAIVPAGDTLNMIGSFWRWIHSRSGDVDVNTMSWSRMELRWLAWPRR
jgi:hypothetical protein